MVHPERVSQWIVFRIQLLPPLGHNSSYLSSEISGTPTLVLLIHVMLMMRGQGGLWGNSCTLFVPTVQGGTAGLIPRAEQDYLSLSPAECGQSRGVLLGNGLESGHGGLLPWRVHQRLGGRDNLVDWEGARVERIGEEDITGIPQAPVVRLCGAAKVTPTGLGIRAVGHPRHRGRLQTGRYGPLGHVPYGPLPGRRKCNPVSGGRQTAIDTGGYGPPILDKDSP